MLATSAGLDKASLLTPGHGYWETLAGLSLSQELHAQSEVGWHLSPSQSLFARGFASLGPAPDAGLEAGFRWEW